MRSREIEKLLPWVFRRGAASGTPLRATLEAMEALHAPAEQALDRLDQTLDARRTEEKFLPFLASWVDLDWLLTVPHREGAQGKDGAPATLASGSGRLRELVAAAAYLSQWRGTKRGLVCFLETATGLRGFRVDETVPGRPFHIRVHCPEESAEYRPLIRRIVEYEKPAYLTYELSP